jgi:hypothetical protein
MKVPVDSRPLVAAVVLFLLLVGFFEAAIRWPVRPRAAPPSTERALVADMGQVEQAATAVRVIPSVPTPEPAPCPTSPIRFAPPDTPDLQPQALRRYVGSVAGETVTLLLQGPTSLGHIDGSFYRHRGGPQYSVSLRKGPHRVLVAATYADPTSPEPSEWELTGWPGSHLRGTWRDTTGHRHPVLLWENYTGGVQAEVHTLRLQGGQTYRPSYAQADCRQGSYDYEYLQFPRPQAVPRALRRAIGSPAVIRRRMRALYDAAYHERREGTQFLLNDFFLLAYQVWRSSTMVTDEHGDYWREFYLYDLTTGRELTLASQLCRAYQQPLNRLLQQHLLHEPQFDFINREHQHRWLWQGASGRVPHLVDPLTVDPPHDDENRSSAAMVLTGSGLALTLAAAELYDADVLERGEYTIEISYRELRPLVRPGTPLARMLQGRGLW